MRMPLSAVCLQINIVHGLVSEILRAVLTGNLKPDNHSSILVLDNLHIGDRYIRNIRLLSVQVNKTE